MVCMEKFLVSIGLDSWEKISFLATIITAFVNGAFLYYIFRQVQLGRKSLDEARRAADMAQGAVKEAMYARIDQQAPRLIADIERPTIGAVESAGEMAWRADQELVLPRDKDKNLYVGAIVTLTNEGKGSAKVTLNGMARWLDDDKDEPLLVHRIEPDMTQRIIKSNESKRFIWNESRTIADWTAAFKDPEKDYSKGACYLEVIVRDYYKQGVFDHIYLEMSGRPLVPIDGDDSHWHVPKKPEFNAVAYPIERAYGIDDNSKIVPPWNRE